MFVLPLRQKEFAGGRSRMNIVVFGAGVQGTLYAVRLARAGHSVKLIARDRRADELRRMGAVIRDSATGRSDSVHLPVYDVLPNDLRADLCFVFVRREQIDASLDALTRAKAVDRFVWMVNHACGSEQIRQGLGNNRVVLGFPGAAGSIQDGIDVYLDIPEQPTVIEASAPDVVTLLRGAGFKTRQVLDMDAWLMRHAVMITAIACAILARGGSALEVGSDRALVQDMILAIREGWRVLDGLHLAAAPLALRAIFSWVPLHFATQYWSRLLGSDRGEVYFAHHTRRSVNEIRALVADVTVLISNPNRAPRLSSLYSVLQTESYSAAT
jgi:2-dehydropantoate 2-reductase